MDPASARRGVRRLAGMTGERWWTLHMKVVLLAESMPDYAVEFAGAVARVAKTSLFAPERCLAPYRAGLSPSIDAPALDWPRLRSPRNGPFLKQLLNLIQARQPDILHVVSQSLTWPALILPLRGRLPLIETVHDVRPHPGDVETRRIPPQFSRILRAQADALIVHSAALKPLAARRFPVPAERIHVLPHLALNRYAELAAGREAPPKDDRFEVLFFGRIYLYKGLDYLIKAAERLGRQLPNLKVTIAGSGVDLPRCRSVIRTPGLFEIRERFIPDEEAVDLFTRADVVALPYIEASQSGVIAMALALAKPVIASDVGDFRDMVTGRAPFGLIVPPREPDALAAAILNLHRAPDLRARFSRAAFDLAQGPLGPEATGKAAFKIYQSLSGGALRKGRAA
jgi:glycosyltransferase involved in cell wall biosynthesis